MKQYTKPRKSYIFGLGFVETIPLPLFYCHTGTVYDSSIVNYQKTCDSRSHDACVSAFWSRGRLVWHAPVTETAVQASWSLLWSAVCCHMPSCTQQLFFYLSLFAQHNIQYTSLQCFDTRGTGIRGLMRGMATLPQGNQELLVVEDKSWKAPSLR